MAGNVKRKDIGRGLLQFPTSTPDAHAVTWEWFKDNVEKLDKMYEETATLPAYMRAYISFLGVGRVGEADKLFSDHKLVEASAHIGRLNTHHRSSKGVK